MKIKFAAAANCTGLSLSRIGGPGTKIARAMTIDQNTGDTIVGGTFTSPNVTVDGVTLINSGGSSRTSDVILVGVDVSK